MANLIVAQLLFLEADDPDKDISLYINSPGGSVTAGMAIFDTMRYIKAPVSTICIGMALLWVLCCLPQAKRASGLLCLTAEIDITARLAALRARPAMWLFTPSTS